MKRWFQANLGAGNFVACAVGFLYTPSETAAGGHCRMEWYAPWLIIFFSKCCAQLFLLFSVFVFLSVCFVLYGKGRIWWQKFYAFRYSCVFELLCGVLHLSAAQAARFFPDPYRIYLRLCRLEVACHHSDMRTEWWQALWKWYLQIQCPFRLLSLSYFLAQITSCVRGGWWQLSPSYSAAELPVWQRGLRLRGCLDWRWCRPWREQSWLPWEAAAAPQLQPFLAIKRIMLPGVNILIVLTGQNMSLLIEIHT